MKRFIRVIATLALAICFLAACRQDLAPIKNAQFLDYSVANKTGAPPMSCSLSNESLVGLSNLLKTWTSEGAVGNWATPPVVTYWLAIEHTDATRTHLGFFEPVGWRRTVVFARNEGQKSEKIQTPVYLKISDAEYEQMKHLLSCSQN